MKKIIAGMIIVFLLIGVVVALDKSLSSGTLGYPKITIRNTVLGIPTTAILDTKITKHTALCPNGACNSEQTFTLYENSAPVEDIKFLDKKGNEIIGVPYSLYTYETETYYEKEIDYANSPINCVDDIKAVGGKNCKTEYVYKDVAKTRQKKVPYVLGTKFSGEKIVGIDANIKGYNYVDYVFKSGGTWINELAPWTTADCYAVGGNSLWLDGNYCVHTFTTNGTLNVSLGNLNVSILIVAGGGGGGYGSSGQAGAGGGAGGLNYTENFTMNNGTNTISIGLGGAAGETTPTESKNGTMSFVTNASGFNLINTTGGGGGGSQAKVNGENGGSGGGANGFPATTPKAGNPVPAGQGHRGSNGITDAATYTHGGGGGGAGTEALNASVGFAGYGGNGSAYSINGTSVYYAGGGGGGAVNPPGTIGIGGLGGGGNGGDGGVGLPGTDGLGGGGGGGNSANNGGKGGSGVIIIRYELISIPTMNATQSYPVDYYNTTTFTVNIGCNFTGNALNNISDVKLNVYDSGNNLDYTNIESGLNQVSYNKSWTTTSLELGTYKWACIGYGNGGVNATTGNRTINVLAFTENSQSYNANTVRGALESFNVNITYDSSFYTSITGSLYYNGTKYTGTQIGTGNTILFNRSLVVPSPAINTNYTFVWQFSLFNGTSTVYSNATSHTQQVLTVAADNCSVGTALVYNFTLLDEDSQTTFNTTYFNSSIEVELDFYSNDGVSKLFNFTHKYDSMSNAKVCLTQNATTSGYKVNGIITYDSDDYVMEYYYLQQAPLTFANTPQNINLLELLTTRSTEFLVTFKGSDFFVVPNALLTLTRKYVSEGVYKTVEAPLTDSNGQAIVHLVASEGLYTFTFTQNGTLLASFPDQRAICQPSVGVCTINLNALATAITAEDYTRRNNLSYYMIFNESAKLITVNFITTTGATTNMQLNVSQYTGREVAPICSTYLSSSSGTIYCTIPSSIGNSSVQSKLYSDGVLLERAIYTIHTKAKDVFGGTGIFLGVLLFMTVPLLMIANPIVMLVGGLLGIGLIAGINLYSGGSILSIGSSIIWLVVAIGIIIWKINKGGSGGI